MGQSVDVHPFTTADGCGWLCQPAQSAELKR